MDQPQWGPEWPELAQGRQEPVRMDRQQQVREQVWRVQWGPAERQTDRRSLEQGLGQPSEPLGLELRTGRRWQEQWQRLEWQPARHPGRGQLAHRPDEPRGQPWDQARPWAFRHPAASGQSRETWSPAWSFPNPRPRGQQERLREQRRRDQRQREPGPELGQEQPAREPEQVHHRRDRHQRVPGPELGQEQRGQAREPERRRTDRRQQVLGPELGQEPRGQAQEPERHRRDQRQQELGPELGQEPRVQAQEPGPVRHRTDQRQQVLGRELDQEQPARGPEQVHHRRDRRQREPGPELGREPRGQAREPERVRRQTDRLEPVLAPEPEPEHHRTDQRPEEQALERVPEPERHRTDQRPEEQALERVQEPERHRTDQRPVVRALERVQEPERHRTDQRPVVRAWGPGLVRVPDHRQKDRRPRVQELVPEPGRGQEQGLVRVVQHHRRDLPEPGRRRTDRWRRELPGHQRAEQLGLARQASEVHRLRCASWPPCGPSHAGSNWREPPAGHCGDSFPRSVGRYLGHVPEPCRRHRCRRPRLPDWLPFRSRPSPHRGDPSGHTPERGSSRPADRCCRC
jgi:hypothetical protein